MEMVVLLWKVSTSTCAPSPMPSFFLKDFTSFLFWLLTSHSLLVYFYEHTNLSLHLSSYKTSSLSLSILSPASPHVSQCCQYKWHGPFFVSLPLFRPLQSRFSSHHTTKSAVARITTGFYATKYNDDFFSNLILPKLLVAFQKLTVLSSSKHFNLLAIIYYFYSLYWLLLLYLAAKHRTL